jgi:3-oxoadipate enol-lactonase
MTWSTSTGVNLKYECAGTGAALILIHELGGSLHSWDSLVKQLSVGFRILRYDQRGAGMSEKVRQLFTMADHAADLEALIESAKLDGPYFIVGCAAGAGIALRFAEKHRNSMAGLVLCCPALEVTEARKKYLIDRSHLAATDGMWAVAPDTLARSYPESLVTDRIEYERYKANFLANDPVSYGLANIAFSEADLGDLGQNISCPCLVLAGKHDSLRPEGEVREVARRIPNARFDLIDSAHLPHVQAPQQLAELIVAFVRDCQMSGGQ